jgi:uncharacterized damage-inducible protein DinB
MHADEIRYLYAYDRWATRRVLGVLGGLDPTVWTRTRAVADDRPAARTVGSRVGCGRCLAPDRHGRLRRVRPPGGPVWQMLVHVVNHGTQHRAEAAAILTAEGRSPGELDLINYAEEQGVAAGS